MMMVVRIGRRLEVLSIEYVYVCRREVDRIGRIGTFLERFYLPSVRWWCRYDRICMLYCMYVCCTSEVDVTYLPRYLPTQVLT